jgi:hypothetical protein
MSNPNWYDASVNAVTVLLNNGFIQVYSGSQPAEDGAVTGTLLATLTFAASAFAASSGGTAVANAIASAVAASSGTAGYFALVKSDATTVVATGTVGTAGADLNFSSVSFSAGATVSCSSFTITG